MSVVELSDAEWGELMSIVSEAPWRRANPLLMKIGEQLRTQHLPPQQQQHAPVPHGNGSQEVRNE